MILMVIADMMVVMIILIEEMIQGSVLVLTCLSIVLVLTCLSIVLVLTCLSICCRCSYIRNQTSMRVL